MQTKALMAKNLFLIFKVTFFVTPFLSSFRIKHKYVNWFNTIVTNTTWWGGRIFKISCSRPSFFFFLIVGWTGAIWRHLHLFQSDFLLAGDPVTAEVVHFVLFVPWECFFCFVFCYSGSFSVFRCFSIFYSFADWCQNCSVHLIGQGPPAWIWFCGHKLRFCAHNC